MSELADIGSIFRVFRLIYPAWARKSREDWQELGQIWLKSLGRYSVEQLARATKLAIERPDPFPPSLGEFLELVPRDRPEHRYIVDQLPPPAKDPAKINAMRAQIREILDRVQQPAQQREEV